MSLKERNTYWLLGYLHGDGIAHQFADYGSVELKHKVERLTGMAFGADIDWELLADQLG